MEVSPENVHNSSPQSENHLGVSSKSDFCSSLTNYGPHSPSLVPSQYLPHSKEELDRPQNEEELESRKLTRELSLAPLIHGMPRSSCARQPSVRLPSSHSLYSLLPRTPDAQVAGPPASECAPEEEFTLKGIPDLKSLMRGHMAAGGSLGIHSGSLPALRSIPVQSTVGTLNNPVHLPNSVGSSSNSMMSTAPGQSAKNNTVKDSSSPLSQCGGLSLAELLEEHSLCAPASASLGSLPLSQLADHSPSSNGVSELTGSLSSLAFCKAPTRDLENLSLSDLIAKSIELDNSPIKKDSFELSLSETRSPGVDSNIDLSVLIKASEFVPKPAVDPSVAPTPEAKVLSSKLGKSSNSTKDSKKSKKDTLVRKAPLSVSWTKALAARPSAFASTLCLRYPLKKCKRRTLELYTTFLYSRQVQDVSDREISPLAAITPFDFKSASPDDIVKANQRKAFTRE